MSSDCGAPAAWACMSRCIDSIKTLRLPITRLPDHPLQPLLPVLLAAGFIASLTPSVNSTSRSPVPQPYFAFFVRNHGLHDAENHPPFVQPLHGPVAVATR